MYLASKPATRRPADRPVVELHGRRWPVSYAFPAFATTAVWLFVTIWLPAVDMPDDQPLAPVAASPAVPAAHTATAWPEPTVRDEAAAPAEPAPTF